MTGTRSLLLVLLAVGCATGAQTLRLSGSPVIPGAEGTVTTRPTDDGNVSLDVRLRHLALPERVQPSATTYVVWAQQPGQADVRNLGALRVNSDLEGELRTVTPLRQFQLFLTAEPIGSVSTPSGQPLMSVVVQ